MTEDDRNLLLHQFVRSYWITRYLLETQPDLVKSLLARRLSHDELEDQVAASLGIAGDQFWTRIDQIVVDHYRPAMADDAAGGQAA